MLAVMRKELRTRMRGWRAMAVVLSLLVLMSIVCYIALSASLNTSTFSANQATSAGYNLFNSLSIIMGALIVFITPAATSTAISGERQRQTLDLLLVTGLSSFGIATGKLFAAIAFDLLLITCALPIFSLVFLFGGVSLTTVAELALLYLMSITCFGAIGLMVSTLTRRSNASTVIAYVTVNMLVMGLAFLSLYLYEAGYAAGGGASSTPLTAYFDPALGLAALLYSQDSSIDIQLPFSVYQVSLVTCAIITLIGIVISTATLRRQRE